MVEITLNGESKQIESGMTVAALLESLGLKSEQVAVERNREIVVRADHAGTGLAGGDVLEVVTFVGGG